MTKVQNGKLCKHLHIRHDNTGSEVRRYVWCLDCETWQDIWINQVPHIQVSFSSRENGPRIRYLTETEQMQSELQLIKAMNGLDKWRKENGI